MGHRDLSGARLLAELGGGCCVAFTLKGLDILTDDTPVRVSRRAFQPEGGVDFGGANGEMARLSHPLLPPHTRPPVQTHVGELPQGLGQGRSP
jgi:hypothetical protein